MKRRKIIAAIVLLCGVALFFIIIGGSSSSNAPLVSAKTGGVVGGSLDYTVGGGNLPGGEATGTVGQAAIGNLSDTFIQGYAQNILKMNNGFAGATPNATNTVSFPSVDSTTNQLASSLGQTLSFKTFSDKDILISDDNSATNQLNYLNAVGSISRKNFTWLKNATLATVIDNAVSKGDSSLIDQYIAAINNEIEQLLALSVPSQLASWHLADLNLWEEKLTVFTAIAGINDDPLKGTVALNEINDIAGKDYALQSQINDKMDTLLGS